jgi:hypothetical protein
VTLFPSLFSFAKSTEQPYKKKWRLTLNTQPSRTVHKKTKTRKKGKRPERGLGVLDDPALGLSQFSEGACPLAVPVPAETRKPCAKVRCLEFGLFSTELRQSFDRPSNGFKQVYNSIISSKFFFFSFGPIRESTRKPKETK